MEKSYGSLYTALIKEESERLSGDGSQGKFVDFRSEEASCMINEKTNI